MKEYRQNVAAIILNKENKIWLGKRADGISWGFPQGGIEAGENQRQPLFENSQKKLAQKSLKSLDNIQEL
ncbi:NUDIX domain-containing protein [Lactococcus lactis]